MNQKSSTHDIFLFGPADNWFGYGRESFIQKLKSFDGDPVIFHISSPGGSLDDALAMHDYIRAYPGDTTARLSGLVASAATFVALAADTVEISANAVFMIHDVHGGVSGTSADLRRQAGVMDLLRDRIVAIYREKTGMPAEKLAGLMASETWMDAQEALALGFADRIIDGVKLAASVTPEQLSAFRAITPAMAERLTSFGGPQDQQTINPYTMNLTNEIRTAVSEGFAGLREWMGTMFQPRTETEKHHPGAYAEFENRLASAAEKLEQSLAAKYQNRLLESEAAMAALKAENLKLQDDILRLKGTSDLSSTALPPDPAPANTPKAPGDIFVSELATQILETMTPQERERL